jgi:hypothetical protein
MVIVTSPSTTLISKVRMKGVSANVAIHSAAKCRSVCPCHGHLGWANVCIIHSVGHMMVTQAELLAASNWL